MKPKAMFSYLEPLSEAMSDLEKQGYRARFKMENHMLLDLASHRKYGPDEVTIMEKFRFEGPSNPDDMSILYAVECKDGLKGVIVNAYGLYADDEIDDFLKQAVDIS